MFDAQPQLDGATTTSKVSWFAVRVRSNFERRTAELLRGKGYTELTPFYRVERRWSDRTKEVEVALFTGYVFCQFEPAQRLPILQTPGVVDVVRFGMQFIPVDEAEINAIRRVVVSGSEVIPWPYLREGQRVRIRSGSMRGLEGILVEEKGTRRLVLSITLLKRSASVEIDRSEVEPIP